MKRSFYVYVSTGGRRVHLHGGGLHEGEKMFCGRRVRAGWLWFARGSGRRRPTNICTQCERARS